MGRIMRRIGTGSATQRIELGGTTAIGTWKSIGTYNLADGNGTMQLSESIADADELLMVIGVGTLKRPMAGSAVVPYSLFISSGFVVHIDNAGTLNYCLVSKNTDTTLSISNVTAGSTFHITVYKR